MNKYLILLPLLLLLPLLAFAQFEKAPVCMHEGWKLQYTTKDSDGKTSVTTSEVLSVDKQSDKWTVTVKSSYPEEAKEMFSTEVLDAMSTQRYVITKDAWGTDDIDKLVSQSKTLIDMQMKQLADKEGTEKVNTNVETDSKNPMYPIVMKAGQKVKVEPVVVKTTVDPLTIKMKLSTEKYECTGRENVTVPAGTFDAYIVQSESKMSVKVLLFSSSESTYQKIWYVEGLGEVKRQTLDKKGKVLQETVLTAITKQ